MVGSRYKILRFEGRTISSVRVSKIPDKVPILVIYIGVWCNGSITDSGSVGEDSNSSTPTCDLVKYESVKF